MTMKKKGNNPLPTPLITIYRDFEAYHKQFPKCLYDCAVIHLFSFSCLVSYRQDLDMFTVFFLYVKLFNRCLALILLDIIFF